MKMKTRSLVMSGISVVLCFWGVFRAWEGNGISVISRTGAIDMIGREGEAPETGRVAADWEEGSLPGMDMPAGKVLSGDVGGNGRVTVDEKARVISVERQGFSAVWEDDGKMLISPSGLRAASGLRDLAGMDARVGLTFAGMGYGGHPVDRDMRAEAEAPVFSGDSAGGLLGKWGGVVEWFRAGGSGMEHGFTLAERPEGGGAGRAGVLEMSIRVDSQLRVVEESGDSVGFMDAEGNKIWSYSGLKVFDRNGGRLPARMEVRRGAAGSAPEILLCVEDAGAHYPLTVDPTFSSAEVMSFPVTSSEYGTNEPPVYMAELGQKVLFFANDGFMGNELWRTDTVTGETELVKDINPAGAGSSPTEMVVFQNAAWFGATDGVHGHQLWKTDGTAEGTVMFRDFSAVGGTKVDNAIVMGGYLYFNVLPSTFTYELWRTDGTPAGTQKVIGTGGAFCDLREPVVLGSLLIYSNPDVNGQLWRTDGTAAGTFMLTGSAGWPRLLTVAGNVVFFIPQGSGQVWRTDGTVAGTVRLTTVADGVGGPPVSMGGFAYFIRTPGTGGAVLVRSDGGPMSTVRTISSDPAMGMQMLGAAGNVVYFKGISGTEVSLWRSDGNSAGTSKLASFGSPDFGRISDSLASGNVLYFSGTTQGAGSELWKSDGTVAGTKMVRDIRPGNLESYPMMRLAAGSRVYFLAYDPTFGKELWRSDGTLEGTLLVRDIYPDELDKRPANMTAVGGSLYFSAYSPGAGRELWKSDGTPAGTALLKDAVPGVSNGFSDISLEQWTAAGNLLFAIPQPAGGRSLWRSDGTADGTFLLKSPVIGTGPSGQETHVVRAFNNLLLFPEGTSASGGLWRSDGSVAGTYRLGAGGDGITPLGAVALFTGPDGNGINTLWKTNGTLAGTSVVSSTRLTVGSPGLTAFEVLNGKAYFSAADATRGTELWRSDGTAAGTTLVADLTAGSGSSSIGVRAALGNRVFFVKGTTAGGDEVWSVDGTSSATTKLAVHTSHIANLTPETGERGSIFYYTVPGNANYELWASRGSLTGASMLKNFGVKNTVSGIADMTGLNGKMLFTLSTSGEGDTLWVTDGTSAGTVPLLNLFPGRESSFPTLLGVARGYLFFAATDATHGRELWVTDGTVAGTRMTEDLNPGPHSSGPYWVGEAGGKLLAAYEAFPAASTPGIREVFINPLPVLQNTGAVLLAGKSVALSGNLMPDGASGQAYFEYGTTETYGTQTPAVPTSATGPMQAVASGLTAGMVYHFRPVYETPGGIFHGPDGTFTVPALQVFAGTAPDLMEILSGRTAPVVLADTPEGTTASLPLTVLNGSAGPVELTGFSLPAGYAPAAGNGLPVTIPAGGSAGLALTVFSSVPGVIAGPARLVTSEGNFDFPLSTTFYLVNDVPVLNPVALRYTPEDTALQGQLTATDPDEQPMIFTAAGPAVNGSVVIGSDGIFVFTPAPDFHGTATFSVKVNDGLADSVPMVVTVEVLPVADPPVLANLPVLTTPAGQAVSGQLSATSVEGKPLSYFNLSNPAASAGSLSLQPDGGFTFVPLTGFSGPVSFLAVASDGVLESNAVLVFIYVTPANQPPLMSAVPAVTVVEGMSLPGISLTVFDDGGSPGSLALTVAVGPGGGGVFPPSAISVSGSGSTRMITLRPSPHSAAGVPGGQVVLTLSLSDGHDTTSQAMVVKVLRNEVGITKSPAGIPELHFTGVPGLSYQIQRSIDLGTWMPVGGLRTAGTDGEILWGDPAAPAEKAYYRLTEIRP
ncbi:MAG: Flagellar hook-length control protein FliK [Verrucomicrobiales bacterium]|nr:Flagellar hook-length control protein FliK [Verrucomicrobiales bacterium]